MSLNMYDFNDINETVLCNYYNVNVVRTDNFETQSDEETEIIYSIILGFNTGSDISGFNMGSELQLDYKDLRLRNEDYCNFIAFLRAQQDKQEMLIYEKN